MGLAGKIIKHNVIISVIINIVVLLISLINLESVSSIFWYKLIYTLKSIRYELFILLIFTLIFSLIYFNSAKFNSVTKVFLICFSILTLINTKPYLLSLIKGRYYYYNNELFKHNKQIYPLEKANEALINENYLEALEYLKQVEKLYPNARYSQEIISRINSISKRIAIAQEMYQSCGIKEKATSINLFQLNTLHYCYSITHDRFYEQSIKYYQGLLREALQNYENLYQACVNKDITQCRSLVENYGWCYFEPMQLDLILASDYMFMDRVRKFVLSEEPQSAKNRLGASWLTNSI